jgi:hypothetical protein
MGAPTASATLLFVNASASALALQEALVCDALARALGVWPDAVSFSGVLASGSDASVGVVLRADSAEGAIAMAAALAALLPSRSPAGVAGAVAASSLSLAGLVSVNAVSGMFLSDAPPPTAVTAAFTLSGAGLNMSSFGTSQTPWLTA